MLGGTGSSKHKKRELAVPGIKGVWQSVRYEKEFHTKIFTASC